MYHQFFGFKEPPFNLTPNSKYFFDSAKHTEALSTLLYAINERKGFCVVTGNIGSGKTTVCRKLINQLDANTQVALITNTHLSSKDLLTSFMDDLEIEYQRGSKSRLHAQLNEYLINQLMKNNNVVLIIDEAQNLTPSVLEEVRMLSNLETENEKLLQIIFLGQPELKQKLAMPKLEQLRQRIAVYFHLTPLSEEDTRNYILHRLHVASDNGKGIFSDDAIRAVYKFSNGVPRLINQICDSALLSAYIYEKKQVDLKIVQEAIGESPVTVICDTKAKYKDEINV
jgi:general secretion pathway protein A